jgi:hypothetical protein
MDMLSNQKLAEVSEKIATEIGEEQQTSSIKSYLDVFKNNDFKITKQVIDKNYEGVLWQIMYYSYVDRIGFTYTRFNYKMSDRGWILANFSFKSEVNELFPPNFKD